MDDANCIKGKKVYFIFLLFYQMGHKAAKFKDHTQRSAHKLAPDFGTMTVTLDMRLAIGMMSLLHPTVTHTSPTPKAFK